MILLMTMKTSKTWFESQERTWNSAWIQLCIPNLKRSLSNVGTRKGQLGRKTQFQSINWVTPNATTSNERENLFVFEDIGAVIKMITDRGSPHSQCQFRLNVRTHQFGPSIFRSLRQLIQDSSSKKEESVCKPLVA